MHVEVTSKVNICRDCAAIERATMNNRCRVDAAVMRLEFARQIDFWEFSTDVRGALEGRREKFVYIRAGARSSITIT